MAELVLDQRRSARRTSCGTRGSGRADRSRTRPSPRSSRMIRPRQAPSASSRIGPRGRPGPGRRRTPRPRRSSGTSARASRSLRLLASSSPGSPAYRAEKTPGAPSRASTVSPESSARTQAPRAGPSRTPSCGRCRRSRRRPRRPRARRGSRRASGSRAGPAAAAVPRGGDQLGHLAALLAVARAQDQVDQAGRRPSMGSSWRIVNPVSDEPRRGPRSGRKRRSRRPALPIGRARRRLILAYGE